MFSQGYKPKGRKWLSPESKSGIAGGRIFNGDCGKEFFWTNNASDPVSGQVVDAFGFMVVRLAQDAKTFAAELGREEYKEFTKEKQIAYAKKMDSGPSIVPEGFNFELEMAKTQKQVGGFFDGIEAPVHIPQQQPQQQAPQIVQQQVVQQQIVQQAPAQQVQQPQQVGNNFFGDIVAPVDGFYSMTEGLTPQQVNAVNVLSKPQIANVEPEAKNNEVMINGKPNWVFDTPVDRSINLFKAPGVVGMCIDYLNSMGRRPRPTLAIGAALSSVGMVGGLSHVDVAYGATSNLFCFNVAGSGTGKEAILQGSGNIVRESGLKNSVFGKIKSEQELYRNLINSQASYYNIDEIGEVLGKITASTESYMTGIIGSLMSVYSKASGFMELGGDELSDVREKVDTRIKFINKKIEDMEDKSGFLARELIKIEEFKENLDRGVLDKPFLAISGCTTPQKFVKIATPEYVLSGFIGRSLIFHEEKDAPRKDYDFVEGKKMCPDLVHRLQKIRNVGNQDLVEVGRTQNYGPRYHVETTKEALAWLRALDYNTDTLAIEHSTTTNMQALVNRKMELIGKVSFILAIGDGKTRTLEHVKWAQLLVSNDLDTKIALVKGNEADDSDSTPVEKTELLKDKVEAFLKAKGQAFLPSVIKNGIYNAKKIEVEYALNQLNIEGKIEAVVEQGKKTKYKLRK